jgi:hypothetical protein
MVIYLHMDMYLMHHVHIYLLRLSPCILGGGKAAEGKGRERERVRDSSFP